MANPLNTIPPKQRGIIYLLLTIVAIVATWFIVKETRAYIRRNKAKKKPQETVTEATQEYNDAVAQGETLSKPQSDYTAAGNTIVTLLDGCETADSEISALEQVIKVVKKPIDWAYFKLDFGVREVDNCGPWTGETQYDLPTLLNDQLDSAGPFAGFYSIDVDGYKKSGFTTETITILRDYLKTIGITI